MPNLISLDDVARVREKLRQGYGARLLERLRWNTDARTTAAWAHTQHPPKHWGAIPAVRRRWNEKVSGDPDVRYHAFLAQTYLAERRDLTALSLGCGTGRNERAWAQTGHFRHIHAVDVSAPRIEQARREAAQEGLDHVLDFEVADVRTMPLAPASLDVILAENALHHVTPLEPVVRALAHALRPGGLLMLRDFVGPSRFQWSKRQVEVVDGLLAVLPERLRTRWASGTVKRRQYRPGLLPMWLSDPSEAAESARIVPLLHAYLERVRWYPLGGTVLHLLFDDIAHHFIDPDEDTAPWLAWCFAAEDQLLDAGGLPSDFVCAVYARR